MQNQKPEQIARDDIDEQLTNCGWIVQNKKAVNLNAGLGVAVTEWLTDVGPADYVLFVEGKPVGIIEAKPKDEGLKLTVHETQTEGYRVSKLKFLENEPLNFAYESTGAITRFADHRDEKPRYRELFTFHTPETLQKWSNNPVSLRNSFLNLPELRPESLRECQINAINNLDNSFKKLFPRALVQMATGSGKTYTAITSVYRLLKYTEAKRILFLVDTKNLGEQAEQEFMMYLPNDDNRKFTELYNVLRLNRSSLPDNNHVYISTIQRLYSILKGKEIDEAVEDKNPNEGWTPREPQPVVYNQKIPIDFFDVIIIDECHRSIYNIWQQVLDYFDSFLIGLTATPDNRTYGFFNENVVSEYRHEEAVADGVNVGYDVYTIDTKVTREGGAVWKGNYVEHRDRLTREKRWEKSNEDILYDSKALDRRVVNPSQLRKVIRTFRDELPKIFPDRFIDDQFEVPKTLIFAKDDSHADDIINMVREEFSEGSNFCQKITYNADNPKTTLSQFRNDYYPRIAVTVDMIATGTDVRPLECLLFMRDVKNANYFEQMKGRGTRTITLDELKKVSPSAKNTKDHFVIVDAVGVTESLKTDSRPLEKKPGESFKNLLSAISIGARGEELFTTLAGRLTRLDKKLTDNEKQEFLEKTGKPIKQVVKELLKAYNPDVIQGIELEVQNEFKNEPPEKIDKEISSRRKELENEAASVFTGEINTYLEQVKKLHEQIIDNETLDELIQAGWHKQNLEKAQSLVKDFETWMKNNKNEIEALKIFYGEPYRRRDLTFRMIEEVYEILIRENRMYDPMNLWRAYEKTENLGKVKGNPLDKLSAIVAIIRKVTGVDKELTSYDVVINKNFQDWVFKKQAGPVKFNEEQMEWLRMIKDYIASSFHIEKEDFDLTPFNSKGGLGKMWQLFGNETDNIINELNEVLAA